VAVELAGERKWRSWWWCWWRTGTTVVPPWFAGEAHGGGSRLGVLWASPEGEGKEQKQREREIARAGWSREGRKRARRNYENAPSPSYLLQVVQHLVQLV